MMVRLYFLTTCLLISFLFSEANNDTFRIYDASDSLLAVIEGENLKTADGEILYTLKGRIIYRGDSDRRRNMLWMVQIPNFTGGRSGKLNKPNSREGSYTSFRSAFYYGNQVHEKKINLMLHFEHEEDEILLKRGLNETLIGKVKGDIEDMSSLVYAAIFEMMKEYKRLDTYVYAQISDWGGFERQDLGQGSIKRLWDGSRSEFVWDGQILKKRWVAGGEEWEFDGRIIRNVWTGSEDEFEWDGQILRRRWGTTPDEYIYDGSTIRSRFGGGPTYTIQGNIVRQQFGTTDRDEWEIHGNVPIPIIMLIVYRVIK